MLQLSLLQQPEFASDLGFIIETKRCLNCGNPSPYQSQHSKDYPNSPIPSMEVMNQLALNSNQINLDIDVGGGYTLRDFPFAYLPSIPSGDSSEAALKLVDDECGVCENSWLCARESRSRESVLGVEVPTLRSGDAHLLPCGFCSAMHVVCNTVKGSMSTRTPFLLLRNVKYVLYRNGESVI